MKISELPVDSDGFVTLNCDKKNIDKNASCFDLLLTGEFDNIKKYADETFLPRTQVYFFKDGWQKIEVEKLSDGVAVFIPKQSFLNKKRFTVCDAEDILRFLRSPDGCPWDRGLTLSGIRANIVEEAYELVDAIETLDKEKIKEETGDLLLQSLFVDEMAQDDGLFDKFAVADALCNKLISRHTHIFGADKASSGSDALKVWESNKAKEKKFLTATQDLKDVPQGMPALMRAQKVGKRAAKVGFDWSEQEGVRQKCLEEVSEVTAALKGKDSEQIAHEIGDLFFSIVNLCRFVGVNAEIALNAAINRFVNRFEYVEKRLADDGVKFSDASPDLTDKLWRQAKEALDDC